MSIKFAKKWAWGFKGDKLWSLWPNTQRPTSCACCFMLPQTSDCVNVYLEDHPTNRKWLIPLDPLVTKSPKWNFYPPRMCMNIHLSVIITISLVVNGLSHRLVSPNTEWDWSFILWPKCLSVACLLHGSRHTYPDLQIFKTDNQNTCAWNIQSTTGQVQNNYPQPTLLSKGF